MTNLEQGRESSNINEIRSSTPGTSATTESTRSKRSKNSTKTETVKRDEPSPQSRKRKGKVGDALTTKEQSLAKKVPRRRSLTVSQQDKRSGIDFEKSDQLAPRQFQEPKRKRTGEATCTVESQLKTLTKPRKLTKAKNKRSPQVTNGREESHGQIKENRTHEVSSPKSTEKETDKSKFQRKELNHSKRSSNLIFLSSQHVKTKTRKKNINNRKHDKAVENTWTRKIRDKSRARKPGTPTKKLDHSVLKVVKPKSPNLISGSHALHSLRKPALSREVEKRLSDNVCVVETSEVKEQPRDVQPGDGNLDVKIGNAMPALQSKETAIALKLANDTSGFVRKTLISVEDSKTVNLQLKEGTSKTRKEDVSMDDKPTTILSKVATRYKSTLESLGSKKIMTAEKLIEELGAIRLASKRNVTKTGKLGKKHIGRSTRAMTIKKDWKDEPIGRDIVKENAQDVSKDTQQNARHIKLGRKTRKNIENQMKKFGLIDKAPQKRELTSSTTTKKSNSPVVSGFDRLISGAGGNKEFESALAQIVTSHDDELGWTKEQEKALQNAYLSIKQTDGCFWHLISKEVPGRSAKECYNKFYSRHPTPSAEAQPPPVFHPIETEYPLSLSDSPQAKSQVISSPKVTKKQKQLEAQKTIRNILGHVDGMEGYKTNSMTVESNHLDTEQDMESVLDREEEEKAVILQSNPNIKDYHSIALPSHVEQEIHNNPPNSFFENVVVSGVSTSSDKENNQPRNGQESNNKKLGAARVELILKQVDHGENLPDNSRHKAANNSSRKKKIVKTNNNVYLHSKDALDFGDTTLDAIQRAKQELRNVFSRTGSRFFDTEPDQIGE